MLKKKTSRKQEFSLKNMQEVKIAHKKDIITWNAEKSFSDHSKVGEALLDCLIDNDTETYIEILESYLRMNKLQVAKKAKIPRSTVQLAFSRNGNPTLKTLAKIVHEAYLKR